MHKNIALLINKMIAESPYHFFTADIQTQKTDGFWSVKIHFINRKNAHSESLVRSLDYIGMVYGEKLVIVDNGFEVEVS